jgi:hypothetical protein
LPLNARHVPALDQQRRAQGVTKPSSAKRLVVLLRMNTPFTSRMTIA